MTSEPITTPDVAVVMGSISDHRVMVDVGDVLSDLGIESETHVVSAHRTPHDMLAFGDAAAARGIKVIIAGAGGAAHLPGMLAATTSLPVIGVPIGLAHLDGVDALLSMAQMPAGVPVATVAIDGARNAAHLAGRILALTDPEIAARVAAHREEMAAASRASNATLAADVSQSKG